MARRTAAAQTADGPIVIAAVEQAEPESSRIFTDRFAAAIVPPSARAVVQAAAWAPARRLLVQASESGARGAWGGVVCRKRYARDQVSAAIAGGVGQVVVLGAGFDTLAYSVAMPAGIPAWEVDLPENGDLKRERLTALFGGVPDGVTLVPASLGDDDVWALLVQAGLSPDIPAVFVAEAVSQYLTPAAFDAVLTGLEPAAAGSRLLFTYVLADLVAGTNLHGAQSLYERFVRRGVWKCGLDPAALPDLLAAHGWRVVEDVGAAEYETRYLRPAGRTLTVTPIERFVLARRG